MANLRTDLRTAVAQTNNQLKAAGLRCGLTVRNDLFYLQATLPSRDGTGPAKQQKVPLGRCGLVTAKKRAMLLGAQLNADSFDWSDWIDNPDTAAVITVQQFRAKARERYDTTYNQELSWTNIWSRALDRLPKNPHTPITIPLIVKCLSTAKPDSCMKRDQGLALYETARFMGMDGWEEIKAESKGYTTKALRTRDIPPDEFYETQMDLFTLLHWRWCVGCLLTYGIRPHELAEGYVDENNRFQVHWDTKTGERIVEPCKSEWVELWRLKENNRPISPRTGRPYDKIKIGGAVRAGIRSTWRNNGSTDDLMLDKRMTQLYNMRHAYARRVILKNVPLNVAAALMGHEPEMHLKRYQRWFKLIEGQQVAKTYGL